MLQWLKDIRNYVINAIPYSMSKEKAHKYIYKKKHKKEADFANPQTYDEKIHWHMIHTYDDNYAKYADKILVRDYVKACGLEDILVPIVGGPYKDVKEIDFDKLPDQFVMKTNHASGPNHYHIVKDKSKLTSDDKKMMLKKFKKALKENFAMKLCQYHYRTIEPRIYCEKLLDDGHDFITDYKVVCSYGRVIAILVCSDRNNGRDYFSYNWEYLDYVKEKYRCREEIKRPSCLEQMVKSAAILSEPFPIARVDFYELNGKLYFGEVTLTPSAGNNYYVSDYGQLEIGKNISIN